MWWYININLFHSTDQTKKWEMSRWTNSFLKPSTPSYCSILSYKPHRFFYLYTSWLLVSPQLSICRHLRLVFDFPTVPLHLQKANCLAAVRCFVFLRFLNALDSPPSADFRFLLSRHPFPLPSSPPPVWSKGAWITFVKQVKEKRFTCFTREKKGLCVYKRCIC